MIVGTIGYTVASGLGVLIREFHRNGIIQRIMKVPHPRYTDHSSEWYKDTHLYTINEAAKFLEGLDALLLFENAFNYWNLVKIAKSRGIRVVLSVMYEWTPINLPVPVDHYLCPSLLDLKYYDYHNSTFLPVPVDRPWRLREKALTFVHNTGHGGSKWRNGTPELLEAMQYVKSPVKLIVRGQPGSSQVVELFGRWRGKDGRVTLIIGEVPDEELYEEGDVLIFPERFNGLSLPMQEAYASGMVVMGSDRFPMNSWLPREPLIRVQGYTQDCVGKTRDYPIFDSAYVNPRDIAVTIDEWYGKDVSEYSRMGRAWAEAHSWEKLTPMYLKVLRGDK